MLTLILVLSTGGDGFFSGREVDFWEDPRDATVPAVDVWTDSEAPPAVLRLLESPTREHAEAYLAWQHERMRRLQVAFEMVEKVQAESRPEEPRSLLYFSRPGCKWCALQERELEGLSVIRVPEHSPLWEEHGVRVTPTIVVGGKIFRGLTPRRKLLEVLR